MLRAQRGGHSRFAKSGHCVGLAWSERVAGSLGFPTAHLPKIELLQLLIDGGLFCHAVEAVEMIHTRNDLFSVSLGHRFRTSL